jgi:peptidyl-prolyl cis-trans isomerase SurA
VNDQIINRSDLERSEQQLAQENQQSNASPADAAERQKNLLRDMIDQQLLLSRGKELGLNADAEVIRRLDEIRKQNHMDTMEDLEKAARAQGVSFEDFKANIRNNVITQQVVRDEVGRRLQMTQTQEQAYYDQHKQEFTQPEQIRLSEILIPTPPDANDASVTQAQKKAEDIAAQIAAGAKFEDTAKKYSGGQSAGQGGDLGLYKRGALAKVLEDQTFSLKPGQMTAPIRTRQGFVILKVTEHQDAGVPPLKDVEPQIQEAMYMQQMQPALRAYLTKLREEAYIEIKDGFVDSGASAKQTRPVYTAYSAPVSKKVKKAQQKRRFDRGGRYSTASKADTKPVAGPVAAVTTTTPNTAANGKTVTNAKPKKIKREKIRFGQAPRNSLPPGPQETGTGSDVGAGAANASLAQGANTEAPGTAIAPVNGNNQVSSTSDTDPNYDPFAPKATEQKKTRYSARAKDEAAAKAKAKAQKAAEKAAAAPPPAAPDETVTRQTQAAPLGLNGDTAKKKTKKVKVKGGKKERLQNKPPAPPPPPPEEIPSKAPDRGTPLEGTPGAGKQPAATPDTPAAPPTTPN